ncbi:hypothetical protein HMI56_005305 [Coelomomyces lativittatus]|nr:hypothetical protein HMI56_005305 [Coelomomyces lativittatus]
MFYQKFISPARNKNIKNTNVKTKRQQTAEVPPPAIISVFVSPVFPVQALTTENASDNGKFKVPHTFHNTKYLFTSLTQGLQL